MFLKLKRQFGFIMKQQLHYGHFILVAVVLSGLAYMVFLLGIILSWLCCMEPAASEHMFSDWTLFMMFTIDFIVLELILYGFYCGARLKSKIRRCKSYFVLGIIISILYVWTLLYFLVVI